MQCATFPPEASESPIRHLVEPLCEGVQEVRVAHVLQVSGWFPIGDGRLFGWVLCFSFFIRSILGISGGNAREKQIFFFGHKCLGTKDLGAAPRRRKQKMAIVYGHHALRPLGYPFAT